MDSDIREALAKSLPDLALIVRRDGVILSCVGGHAVRGVNAGEQEISGRTLDTLWPESMAAHVLQTVRRILKTRKSAQQRYQDGDLKLELRFQAQGPPLLEHGHSADVRIRQQPPGADRRSAIVWGFGVVVIGERVDADRVERVELDRARHALLLDENPEADLARLRARAFPRHELDSDHRTKSIIAA